MIYNLYCSPKPYGTSVPPFYSTRGYLPSNSLFRKLLYIQQFDNISIINLLTTILPDGKPLAYQRPHVGPRRNVGDGLNVLQDGFEKNPGKYQDNGLHSRVHLG